MPQAWKQTLVIRIRTEAAGRRRYRDAAALRSYSGVADGERALGANQLVGDGARSRGLECPAHVEFTIGVALVLGLAAEVEFLLQRVTERPAAVVWQQRFDGLSLTERDLKVIGAEGGGGALIFTHGSL